VHSAVSVTVLGYGSLVPMTTPGRAFCCVYAAIGIPFCLIVLVNVGNQLNATWRMVDERIEARRPRIGRRLRSSIVVALSALLLIVLPSAVFSRLEGWDFFTAVYFSLISLSTIGFGDYVAGEKLLNLHQFGTLHAEKFPN